MKPMPQIIPFQGNRRLDCAAHRLGPRRPVTDAHYHSVGQQHSGDADSQRSLVTSVRPSFRLISREFLREETHQSFRPELFLFGVIILISVWPLFALLQAWIALPG
jgi:hypothetical protein